jgi:hypothetical protein
VADELEQGLETPGVDPPADPPAVDWEVQAREAQAALDKERNDRRAEDGRLQKYNTILASQGLRVDPQTEQVVQIGGGYATAPTYQQPPPEPEEYMFDDVTDAQIDKRIESRAQQLLQNWQTNTLNPVLSVVLGNIEQSTKREMAADVPEWKDINTEVMSELQEMGFATLTQARAANPKLVQTTIDAVRFRRGAAPQGSAAGNAEAERRARAQAAADVGGGAGRSDTQTYDFNAEELAEIRARGMTPEEYIELASGPAKIAPKGAK